MVAIEIPDVSTQFMFWSWLVNEVLIILMLVRLHAKANDLMAIAEAAPAKIVESAGEQFLGGIGAFLARSLNAVAKNHAEKAAKAEKEKAPKEEKPNGEKPQQEGTVHEGRRPEPEPPPAQA